MEFATTPAEQPALPVFVFCTRHTGTSRMEGINPLPRLIKVNAVPNGGIPKPPSSLMIQDS